MSYFATIPSIILRNKSLSSDAKVLYGHLTLHAETNGDYAINYFSLKYSTGFSTSSLKYYFTELLNARAISQLTKTRISLDPWKKNKDQVEIDYSFVDEWINKWNRVFRIDVPNGIYKTEELVDAIKAREKVFGKEKLLEAIEKHWLKVHQEDWWGLKENRQHRGRAILLVKDDGRVESALAFSGKKIDTEDNDIVDDSILN